MLFFLIFSLFLSAPWLLPSLFSSDWNILRQVLLGSLPKPSFQSPLFCVFLCLFYFTFLFVHPLASMRESVCVCVCVRVCACMYAPQLELSWTTCRWVPLTHQAICHFSRCSRLLCQTRLSPPPFAKMTALLYWLWANIWQQWHTHTPTAKSIWPLENASIVFQFKAK